MQSMARKSDIDDIKDTMSKLATKAEVEAKILALKEEVERNKPATLAKQIVAISAGIVVVASLFGLGLAIVRAIDRIPAHASVSAKP